MQHFYISYFIRRKESQSSSGHRNKVSIITFHFKSTGDLSLIRSPTIVYFWDYMMSFILDFIGDLATSLTFSRETLSTGCLFIMLATSDTF